MWVALRMFEERQNLISKMGSSQKDLPASVLERVEESQVHIDRIRAILKAAGTSATMARVPTTSPPVGRDPRG